MTQDSYNTIKNPSEGLFKDRGSKFLAFAYPVNNEDDIADKLGSLRKKYHDARHHCYAWRLGETGLHIRANDDGEPSSTAGKPILGQIQKYELTNILVVVVRYFGGTLLGTGGLINAYREATIGALENAESIRKTIDELWTIRFPYSSLSMVMKALKQEQAVQVEQDFGDECRIKISIPLVRSNSLANRLKRIEKVLFDDGPASY